MPPTWRRALWPSIDPTLIDAGREGELLMARARVGLLLVLMVTSLATLLRHPGDVPALLAVLIEIGFIAIAVVIVRIARAPVPRPWLGFVTAAMDVSFVSFYQVMTFAAGYELIALTSRAMFALYLLAIAATSLRQDGRIATLAGVLAAVEWLGVVSWARVTGRADAAVAAGRFYGDVNILGQGEELVMIAASTALAHVIVERSRALQLSSIRDGLTGLLSRSHFEERLATELIRATRQKRPLSVAIVDLDRFKRINDTFGHPAGDQLLREVAARLARGVRRTDLSARIGGDEFCLVFIDSNLQDAAAKLEAIRTSVADIRLPWRSETVSITCSAGLAMSPVDGNNAESLIVVADARLLSAKQAGRNRLVVS